MARLILMSLVALVLAVGSSRALAAEYFVSPEGKDTNPGTRQQPWQTLAHASAVASAGDTVIFLDGHYSGVLEPANSGRPGAPVVFRAANRLGAVLTGGESSDGERVCVRMKDRQWVVIEGFYLLPDRGGWMRLDGCQHCVVRDCRMENATHIYSPVYCKDCHYNRYERLECWRSNNIGKHGHVSGDMWNNFASTHNVFEEIHISRAGHRPFGLWFDCPYNVVRRCIFDCRWGRNFEFFSTPRLLMEQCVVTNGFDGTGSADGRSKLFVVDSIFRYNVIYRNYYGALVINSYRWKDNEPFAMLRSRLYNNTWYRNHMFGFQMTDYGEHPQPHYVAGNIFQNNIFAHNDPGGDGLALLLASNIGDDNRFRYNDLYGDRPGCRTVRYCDPWPHVYDWPGPIMTAAEANAQRPAQFVGNIDADPRFADAAQDDYSLPPDSPCLDAGRPLAHTRQAGAGREVPVDDARWFYDGFGIPGEVGDLVFVGRDKKPARVLKVDLEHNLLLLDHRVVFERGDPVTLPYVGKAPDLGAWERGAQGQPWDKTPRIPPGLRVKTMEDADEPVVVTDFEPENLEQWHYYWNFERQKRTDSRMDDTTAASGKHSMRVFATGDGAIMSCDIRPRWWDIDRFPIIKLAYRIPPGVPVGLWLVAFPSTTHGRGMVCIGGSPARQVGGYKDLGLYELRDDDQWHEVTMDARAIRRVFPDVKLLQMFRFYTQGNGKKGQQYWFDNFRLLPAGKE
ncbi:MAG: hypothetical protein J7M26_00135 [Armatimonadetes bacterium]|nr:hypothetical protein [Armatimonadota bacterium]